MKVIFMGTPDFSVGTLEALIEAGHEVVLAVTQPDKPKGRGGKMQYTPVKEAALAHGIPVFQPVKIREAQAVEELRKYNADIMVVIAFGQILPKEILEMTPYGCINVHASLLPSYRGAAPIQWAVINGDKVSGVTTMQMAEGLDTGDMLLKAETVIEKEDTAETIHDRLSEMGKDLLLETLEKVEKGEIVPQKQDDSLSCYAKMLKKDMGKIDMNWDAAKVERYIRGMNSWPSAYTTFRGKTLKLWRANVLAENTGEKPGTVVDVLKNSFIVQTGDGCLEFLEVQLEGKKRMDAQAFLRGYTVEEGMMLPC